MFGRKKQLVNVSHEEKQQTKKSKRQDNYPKNTKITRAFPVLIFSSHYLFDSLSLVRLGYCCCCSGMAEKKKIPEIVSLSSQTTF
jgi:hypothetical protein